MPPVALTETVPLGTAMDCAVPGVRVVPLMSVTESESPSASESLVSRSRVIAAEPKGMAPKSSSVASGGVLSAASTEPVTLAVSVPPLPSEMV